MRFRSDHWLTVMAAGGRMNSANSAAASLGRFSASLYVGITTVIFTGNLFCL